MMRPYRRMAEHLMDQLDERADADWSKRRTFAIKVRGLEGDAAIDHVVNLVHAYVDGMTYVREGNRDQGVLVDVREPEKAPKLFMCLGGLVRSIREVDVEPLQGAA